MLLGITNIHDMVRYFVSLLKYIRNHFKLSKKLNETNDHNIFLFNLSLRGLETISETELIQ